LRLHREFWEVREDDFLPDLPELPVNHPGCARQTHREIKEFREKTILPGLLDLLVWTMAPLK